MSRKTWIIIIILIVGLFGFLMFADKPDNGGNKDAQTSGNPRKITSEDHVAGSPEKKIVVMEYLDFQCPGCKGLNPAMQQARKDYGDKVTFVVRHFPLTNIHQNGLASSRAAEAAAKQGKFFEMGDLIFASQESWAQLKSGDAQKTFEGYAKQLGLNVDQFKKDFASSEVLERINRDRGTGGTLGVQSTPTIFINGQKIEITAENDIARAIQEVISKKETDPNQK